MRGVVVITGASAGAGRATAREFARRGYSMMAGEEHGPTVVRQLEPPGFLALNYGATTPVAIVLAHVVFGAILGLMYRV